MEKFPEKQKSKKKVNNNNEEIITKVDKNNKIENVYNNEYRDSNTSEMSNCEDNNFFSPENSPILSSSSDYKNIEKIPLLEVNKNKDNNMNFNQNVYSLCSTKDNTESDTDNSISTLDSLILNLKIISKLKPGYKLSVKENNEIYIDTGYLQYIYRFFSDNSRDSTTTFLENLDINITSKIEEIIQSDNNDMFLNSKENILLNLSHNLNLSLIGLNNLINTYSTDDYIVAKIEMIINNFQLKIRKIANILKVN